MGREDKEGRDGRGVQSAVKRLYKKGFLPAAVAVNGGTILEKVFFRWTGRGSHAPRKDLAPRRRQTPAAAQRAWRHGRYPAMAKERPPTRPCRSGEGNRIRWTALLSEKRVAGSRHTCAEPGAGDAPLRESAGERRFDSEGGTTREPWREGRYSRGRRIGKRPFYCTSSGTRLAVRCSSTRCS